MISLVLVRHGETDWNRSGRLQGHTDIALNPRGIDQAARLAAALSREPLVAVWSSDLGRALATARPVAAAFDLPVREDAGLRERHFGRLEGKTLDEIAAAHPDEAERMRTRDAMHRAPGGESPLDFSKRVLAAVERIARHEAALAVDEVPTVLVVTHGGVLDMVYRAAFGIALDAARAWPTANAAINRVEHDGTRFVVREWGTPVDA